MKCFNPQVHKGKFKFVHGIAWHVWCEWILHNLRKTQNLLLLRLPLKKQKLTSQTSFLLPFSATKSFQSSPNQHYEMSHETKFPIDITTDLGNNLDDPAQAVHSHISYFHFKISKPYIILGISWSIDWSPAQPNSSMWLLRRWHPVHWWRARYLEIHQQLPLPT